MRAEHSESAAVAHICASLWLYSLILYAYGIYFHYIYIYIYILNIVCRSHQNFVLPRMACTCLPIPPHLSSVLKCKNWTCVRFCGFYILFFFFFLISFFSFLYSLYFIIIICIVHKCVCSFHSFFFQFSAGLFHIRICRKLLQIYGFYAYLYMFSLHANIAHFSLSYVKKLLFPKPKYFSRKHGLPWWDENNFFYPFASGIAYLRMSYGCYYCLHDEL